MKVCQYIYQADSGWLKQSGDIKHPDILLAFGSGKDCTGDILVSWWKQHFPNAQLLGCSSAGEIIETEVHTNSIVVTAIQFEKTTFKLSSLDFKEGEDSLDIGKKLANNLPKEKLKLCFVLSDGLFINGTRLVEGLKQQLPKGTLLTGGLAGDGKRFSETLVCVNEKFSSKKVVILGLYGDHIDTQYGSMGGWDSFGPSRLVTKSKNNVLFTMDDQNALELYKKYLGHHAKNLPYAALRFPLLITPANGQKFVRTVLSIDEKSGSMTFAGDIPQGSYAELMRANYDRLIDGAADAANDVMRKNTSHPELALLISCVGRKLVLDQRIEEEVEAVYDSFGQDTVLAGFYSYGEICPFDGQHEAILHNQTMTITTFREF
tara:strand:- start:19970 stop:21097 length:1128 start_codon:yes stop_codon:yes gene_type:complete